MLGPSGFFLPDLPDDTGIGYHALELIHTSENGFSELYRGCKNGRFFVYKALKKEFKIIGSDKYANLKVITKNSGQNPIIQLLNDKDEVIREKSEDANGTLFEHLAQGDYYLRLYNDENNDGEWTPGDFKEKRHAEKVFYLNTKVHLRANWDIDQEWDVEAIKLEKQKPETLKKEAAKNNSKKKKK